MTDDIDVIVAGAGPAGLFLAIELRLAGASVTVLEAELNPAQRVKLPPFGLRGLNAATIEALDRRDLLDPLLARTAARPAPPPHWAVHTRRPAGHFAGIPVVLDQLDEAEAARPAGGLVLTSMADVETVLTERAQAMGVAIRRGHRLTDVVQREDGMIVTTQSADAAPSSFTARWLVGCDGARSVVRKAAAIGFAGTEPEFTGYSLEATLADPNGLTPGRNPTDTGMYTFAPPGFVTLIDFDGGAHHRAGAITRGHAQAVLRRVIGSDVTLTALHHVATWTDRAFLAERYRRYRILLAGDAAHIHSPLGGQGLNLGIGDAVNLGWKLAAVVRGDAPPALLDSYAEERRPVAARVLDWSRAQVALMRPAPAERALADIMRALIATSDGARVIAAQVRGTGLRYASETEPPVGTSAEDRLLADGGRVNERLRDGRGLLLRSRDGDMLGATIDRWPGRIGEAIIGSSELAHDAQLIRPDGIVAWRGSDAQGLTAAARRWFGPPER